MNTHFPIYYVMNTYKLSISIILLSSLACIFGCNKVRSTKLELVLNKAGENKIELQQVLNHYSKNPKDSLKYKAACFLIENMTWHKSRVSSKLSDLIQEAKRNALEIKKDKSDISEYRAATMALDSIKKKYGPDLDLNYEIQYDIEHINADYLIDNIDLSFEIWESVPWGKLVSFEQFCNEILPYRIFDESLSYWRKTYYERFRTIQDSISPNATLIQVCKALYDEIEKDIWYHVDGIGTSSLDAITMLKCRYGSCKEKVAFTLFAMRSLCIPGSIDLFLQTPNRMYPSHFWNQMKNSNGNPIEFLIGDSHLFPSENSCDTTRKKGVIYRMNFAEQKESLPLKYKNKDIPNNLTNIYLSNVSKEYFPKSNVCLHVESEGNDVLYLCLFNNREWIPVVFSDIQGSKAIFEGLESDIVYLPAFYKEGSLIYADLPFLLNEENETIYFRPDTTKRLIVLLERKHPLPTRLHYLKRWLLGGKFECANKADFSDAQILHVVSDANDLKKTTITIDSSKKYRYVRYVSAENGRCNMAELAFYSSDGTKLNGSIIGTDGSYNYNPQKIKETVFDNDPLTFFESHLLSGAWVGLDFGKPYSIKQIIYQFRNDDNLIRKNDNYELFYFTKHGPVSLGKQIGTDKQVLIFDNVPENSLLLLRNHTRGREERIFTYENERQVFY